MAQILCFASTSRKLAAFSSAISSAGHDPVRCRSVAAALRRARTAPLAAIVVEHCREGRHFREFLKNVKHQKNVPLIVVSRHVVNAFQVAGRLADLYLEEPVAQAELAGFVSILVVPDGPLLAAEPAPSGAAVTPPVQQTKLPAMPAAGELMKPAAAAAH